MSETNLMGAIAVTQWQRHFSKLRDTRRRRGKRHRLVDVVLISLLAMLCGCDDADDIAFWADARREMLQKWFPLQHGTPSQDTILRVFGLLKPKTFSRAVASWLDALGLAVAQGHIAIDGKSLRGSLQRGSDVSAVHIVSAWLREAGISLGQVKTHDKSNEIKAIPELLKILDISGSTVSIDAAGCYIAIAEQIIAQQGHYLLAVKDNQPTLRRDCERVFSESRDKRRRTVDELPRPTVSSFEHVDGGHGRIEERVAYLCRDLRFLTTACAWPGLTGIGLIESRSTANRTGVVQTESRYYIISNPTTTVEELLSLTRGHWSVESMHWVLDVVFKEDASRIVDRRAAENFGLLRKTALSLLRAAPLPNAKKRMSYKNRRRWCDYFPEYLLRVFLAVHARKASV